MSYKTSPSRTKIISLVSKILCLFNQCQSRSKPFLKLPRKSQQHVDPSKLGRKPNNDDSCDKMTHLAIIRVKWKASVIVDIDDDLSHSRHWGQKAFSLFLTGGETGSWSGHWSMKPSEGTNSPVTVCAQAST